MPNEIKKLTPVENHHRFLLGDPADFANFQVLWERDGVQAIGGKLRVDKEAGERGISKEQMLCFDATKWNFNAATEWCKGKGYSVLEACEAAQYLPAKLSKMSFKFEGAETKEVEGKYFVKQVARLGTWNGVPLSDEYMNHIVKQFAKMTKDGIKVPVYLGHPETKEEELEHAVGWCRQLERDGEYLVAQLEITDGNISRKIASYDTSLNTDHYESGDGKKYFFAATHIALTPNPAVTDLGEWEKIAASRKVSNEIVYKQEGIVKIEKESDIMANVDFKKLSASLGKEVSPDNVETVLLDMAKVTSELQDKYQKLEASIPKVKEISEETFKFATKSYASEIDALVQAGTIQPAKKTQIEQLYLGDRLKLALSRDNENNELDKLLSILKGLEPLDLTRKSKGIAIDPAEELKVKNKPNEIIEAQKDPVFQQRFRKP